MKPLLDFLCQYFDLDEDLLRKFVNTAPYRYKKYKIPKRKPGQFRNIAQPSKELKILQKAAIQFLEENFKVHGCATAYVHGKGIKDNIAKHVSNDYILKMDFKNFFPSLVPKDLLVVATKQGLNTTEEQNIWSRLFFYRPYRKADLCLSIGAPTSPIISNIVMFEFDEIVDVHCKNRGLVFTRYADDLTFSTKEKGELFKIPAEITQIIGNLEFPSLLINQEKTVFSSKKHNRHVTGLVMTNNNEVSLGRARKRMISSMVHKSKLEILADDDCLKLNGLLAFANDVEPEFVGRLINKYGRMKILIAFERQMGSK